MRSTTSTAFSPWIARRGSTRSRSAGSGKSYTTAPSATARRHLAKFYDGSPSGRGGSGRLHSLAEFKRLGLAAVTQTPRAVGHEPYLLFSSGEGYRRRICRRPAGRGGREAGAGPPAHPHSSTPFRCRR